MAQSRQPKKIIMWALTYDCNASCEYCYLKDFRFFTAKQNRHEKNSFKKTVRYDKILSVIRQI